MWSDYGVFGTHELWNNVRTYNYAMLQNIKDNGFIIKEPGCENLPVVCDAPPGGIYHTPEIDEAPWYDANFPESADFAGIWVDETPGFDTFATREIESTPFGSVASSINLTPKTVTVTAWLIGKTCCATQYGLRWLHSRLRERDCVTNEETSVLSMFDCCPTNDETDLYPTTDDITNKYLRAMYDVKVVDFPKIIDQMGNCCGNDCMSTSIQVQWTFLLQNPKLYGARQLSYIEEEWNTDIQCVDFACDPCPTEDTVEIERTYAKTRYPVKLKLDQTWCPVGNWVLADYFDNPEQGYLDIVEVETNQVPLQVSVSYDGTWSVVGDWDALDIDLCSVDIQVVEAIQGGSVPTPPATTVDLGGEDRVQNIELTATTHTGGTWAPIGWTPDYSASVAFPQDYSSLAIINDCGCDSDTGSCEVTLNEDGTWELFNRTYVGILPPSGCDSVSVRRSYPGTYTVIEEVPVSEAFSGCGVQSLDPPEPFATASSCYCQPLEWVQLAMQIPFSSTIERAEPYIEFYSGDSPLYNFRADFYALPSSTAEWVVDGVLTEDLSCTDPSFSLQIGKSIPANSTLIYEPRTRSINLIYNETVYDYSGSASGFNGGTPYFIEFPECYGMVVVLTAEVHNGTLPSSLATVSLGYVPYVYVGV